MDRFWSKVDSSGGPDACWLWTRPPGAQGYGQFKLDGKRRTAPHVAVELSGRTIPAGLVVRHTCDVRLCVNPSHLLIGTQAENVADMMARGRYGPPRGTKGVAHWAARLNDAAVHEIRRKFAQGMAQNFLAQQYAVSCTTVNEIVHRKTWRHI